MKKNNDINLEPSMALNRGHIEDFVNHPRNRHSAHYAQGVQLPCVPIRLNNSIPRISACYVQVFAIAIYSKEQALFKLSGITTLN